MLIRAAGLICFAVVAGISVSAQTSLAVVNVGRLLAEAPQAMAAQKALKTQFGSRREQIQADRELLITDGGRYENERATMTAEQLQTRLREMRVREAELEQRQKQFLKEFNQQRNTALAAVQKQLMDEVQRYATAHNYDLVIGEGVLKSASAVDITTQILEGLKGASQAP